MKLCKKRKTSSVRVGNLQIGSRHPVIIQSMTNTPTADVPSTLKQIKELIDAGSEMVRVTVNTDEAAQAIPVIIRSLREQNYGAPIIGDFHYNGHYLLTKYPPCAALLDKYRINPGNVGQGSRKNSNFQNIIRIAIQNKKPVRIGVNAGSIDQAVLKKMLDKNARMKKPKALRNVFCKAMVQSALQSARLAQKTGLRKNQIILSVKMSDLQDMVLANTLLAEKCDYPIHLGLTEAGSDIKGLVSSSAALAILLEQGIGDTIRISLTPQVNVSRSREVKACQELLQSLGLRYFCPTVISCPGCGRTDSEYFQRLAEQIKEYIEQNIRSWKEDYEGIEKMRVAVMGCVVNGPGESRHADIGISLPGKAEHPSAPVYIKGQKISTLRGEKIKDNFVKILEKYIQTEYKK